mmetsp:Transcript_35335/g.88820  ORF Transcript_35335/g.88820 Transcript_35335/m.88820 type:complete len:283 (+) Transcript_35335:1552-2400(+)
MGHSISPLRPSLPAPPTTAAPKVDASICSRSRARSSSLGLCFLLLKKPRFFFFFFDVSSRRSAFSAARSSLSRCFAFSFWARFSRFSSFLLFGVAGRSSSSCEWCRLLSASPWSSSSSECVAGKLREECCLLLVLVLLLRLWVSISAPAVPGPADNAAGELRSDSRSWSSASACLSLGLFFLAVALSFHFFSFFSFLELLDEVVFLLVPAFSFFLPKPKSPPRCFLALPLLLLLLLLLSSCRRADELRRRVLVEERSASSSASSRRSRGGAEAVSSSCMDSV